MSQSRFPLGYTDFICLFVCLLGDRPGSTSVFFNIFLWRLHDYIGINLPQY